MNIAIVQGAFLPVPPLRGGAVEKIWFALGQEFVRQGHTVTHYSRLSDGLPARETIGGVKHVRVRGADNPSSMLRLKWEDLRYTQRVARVLQPAQIVVTNTFWAPIVFSPKRHGALWVHVQRYPKGQMRFYGKAACLQTVSKVIADAMIAQAPAMRPKILVIPNPLPSLVTPVPPPVRDPKLVLFVGRLHPEKGIELLVEAARILKGTTPGLRFRVVGPSETRFGGGGPAFRQRLGALAEPLGSEIEFTGPIFDEALLASHFASAGVFIYPSLAAKGEASPVAPLEALARGCPVITSDLACFDDTIGTGVFAHRFDQTAADAPARLAEVIARVVADREGWAIASAAAKERAQYFTIQKVGAQYLAGFAELLR